MQRIQVVDSHTGGEPTRVVIAGGPDLGDGSLAERRERFPRRSSTPFAGRSIREPRGSDVLVGAIALPAGRPGLRRRRRSFSTTSAISACAATARSALSSRWGTWAALAAGSHVLETPVGRSRSSTTAGIRVSLENVASYRSAANVTVNVDGLGEVTGDVAWGGNWFFLVREHRETLESGQRRSADRRNAAHPGRAGRQGITGANGAEIDHIELFGPPGDPGNHSRNFVLCPGGAYDRSPCGTGTSAKIACLAADGKLQPGEIWRQESILGSVFEASYRRQDGQVLPRITGQAYVTAEASFSSTTPIRWPGASDDGAARTASWSSAAESSARRAPITFAKRVGRSRSSSKANSAAAARTPIAVLSVRVMCCRWRGPGHCGRTLKTLVRTQLAAVGALAARPGDVAMVLAIRAEMQPTRHAPVRAGHPGIAQLLAIAL